MSEHCTVASKETPATRAARAAGIAFTLHEYRHDARAPAFGMEAAEALGLDPERVFKTLVVDVAGELTVCLIPAPAQLDTRSLGKRVQMAPAKRAESVTGYVAGGISPLGQRRALPTLIDESATAFDTIYVSAGRRGLEIELAPADLRQLTDASMRALQATI
jgi:Cys-tRNA(Pro)/Cys-tRNA(Cys) deacylase